MVVSHSPDRSVLGLSPEIVQCSRQAEGGRRSVTEPCAEVGELSAEKPYVLPSVEEQNH